jgi:uncharacterized protein (TIGR00251 family)
MMDMGLNARETSAGLQVRLHVVPRAKRCEISGTHNGALKVKVSAPPVDDAANRAIIEFFSTLLQIPKSRITILAGRKSRDKTLHFKNLSLHDFGTKTRVYLVR